MTSKDDASMRSLWLSAGRSPTAHIRLFCLPHAGAGTAIYNTWKRFLPAFVEVCPIQVPGREGRLNEPSLTDCETLIDQIASAVSGYLDKPYVIFGHSMGALLAFELARKLRSLGHPAPKHLFVSGRNAARPGSKEDTIHLLPDDEFLAELAIRYGNLPREVLETPELLEIYLPILRADLTLLSSHQYEERLPLDCPISAFCGKEDGIVTKDGLEAWGRHTTANFETKWFEGGHFYLLGTSRSLLLETIAERLSALDASLATEARAQTAALQK